MFNVNVQSKNKFREDLFRMRRVTVNFDVNSLKMFKDLRPTHRRRPTCVKASAAIIFYVLTDTGGSHTALFFFQHSQRRFLFFLRETLFF